MGTPARVSQRLCRPSESGALAGGRLRARMARQALLAQLPPLLRIGGALVLCGALPSVSGCVSQPRRPAYGTPLTCPETRLPETPDGGTSPDAVRCSYDDALGAAVVHISGKVMLEQEVGPGIGVPEVELRIQRLGVEGEADISRAKTDAQGGYRLSGAFQEGDYMISVHDDDGNVLVRQRFEITPKQVGKIDGLTVWLPLDQRLRGEAPPLTPPQSAAPRRGADPEAPSGEAAPPATGEGPSAGTPTPEG